LLLAAGCGGGGGTTAPTTNQPDCSVPGKNTFVRDTMRDIYLWYRELPDVSPAGFASPEEYLEAIRYRALDTAFSYVADRAADQAFFSDSQFIGFGFSSSLLGPDDYRVTDVFGGSPAAEAGLQRGARFLEINGRTVADLVATGDLDSIFGASEVGITATIRFRDRGGREHSASMVKRMVTIPPVGLVQTFDSGGRKVGYILLKNFVTPTTPALDDAFSRLAADGVDDLVLDVRYNGGGLVSVAQHLAGLIGGDRTRDRLFVRFVHNDKNTSRDASLTFPGPANALGLQRLVVIATQSSASASELMISGLRPYLSVTVVGDRTFGKPVGQYSFEFCDKVLHPVSFSARNALDEGDYFGGIAADCRAADDLTRAFGDEREASLAEALRFLRLGRCSTTAEAAARSQAARRPERQPHRQDGWQSLLVAY
jgi:C-terminal processing protease CtpA/Prc